MPVRSSRDRRHEVCPLKDFEADFILENGDVLWLVGEKKAAEAWQRI